MDYTQLLGQTRGGRGTHGFRKTLIIYLIDLAATLICALLIIATAILSVVSLFATVALWFICIPAEGFVAFVVAVIRNRWAWVLSPRLLRALAFHRTASHWC